jgi:hypothetical protein
MAGKYGSASLAVSLDDAPGGTLRVITPHVREIGGIKVEAITEESNPFGTAWRGTTPTGTATIADVAIKGHFDTSATTGPHVVMGTPDKNPQDATRTFVFAPGDGKTFTAECRLVSYEVIAENEKLTQYEAVIRFDGVGTWA